MKIFLFAENHLAKKNIENMLIIFKRFLRVFCRAICLPFFIRNKILFRSPKSFGKLLHRNSIKSNAPLNNIYLLKIPQLRQRKIFEKCSYSFLFTILFKMFVIKFDRKFLILV